MSVQSATPLEVWHRHQMCPQILTLYEFDPQNAAIIVKVSYTHTRTHTQTHSHTHIIVQDQVASLMDIFPTVCEDEAYQLVMEYGLEDAIIKCSLVPRLHPAFRCYT